MKFSLVCLFAICCYKFAAAAPLSPIDDLPSNSSAELTATVEKLKTDTTDSKQTILKRVRRKTDREICLEKSAAGGAIGGAVSGAVSGVGVGIASGAAAGSWFPGVGTLIGGFIGGIIAGAAVGSAANAAAGAAVCPD